MNNCFVINGRGGTGKDTFIEYVEDYFWDYKITNVSSIDPIKEIARNNGWDGVKNKKSRKMLSDLKKVFIEYNNLPTMYLSKYMFNEGIVFLHIREPEEIEKIIKINPFIRTLLIDRDIDMLGNDADDLVYDYQYDFIIDNNGTLNDLKDAAVTLYKGDWIMNYE